MSERSATGLAAMLFGSLYAVLLFLSGCCIYAKKILSIPQISFENKPMFGGFTLEQGRSSATSSVFDGKKTAGGYTGHIFIEKWSYE